MEIPAWQNSVRGVLYMTARLVMKVVAASLTITLAVMIGVFLLRTRGRPRVGSVIPLGDGTDHAEQDIEQRFEKHFITAHDGFMAVDNARQITVGINPSAVEHNTPNFKSPWDTLLETIGWRERGTKITFSAGSQMIDGKATDRDAEKDVSLAAAFGKELLAGLNPARVNIANVTINASDTPRATAKVLVLPRDYDGPIFISDIDDTLRDTDIPSILKGKRQSPIDGVQAIFSGVAGMGVPIIYLSAGTTAIHSQNEDFLTQLPPGILLDNQDWKFGLSDLSNPVSAKHQAAYKYGVLQKIQETYPKSKPYGIGDDKYGDALAYTKAGVRAFIHDVAPAHANDPDYVPANFSGVKTPTYTDAFRVSLLAELAAAVKGSQSVVFTDR
jgi:hypothetical protein